MCHKKTTEMVSWFPMALQSYPLPADGNLVVRTQIKNRGYKKKILLLAKLDTYEKPRMCLLEIWGWQTRISRVIAVFVLTF
jgi:hypothetical protein